MDNDIKLMFEEKNRNILITNLEFDLNKNIDSMCETITNIFNMEFDSAIKNIILVYEDYDIKLKEKELNKKVDKIKTIILNETMKNINLKRNILANLISTLDFKEETMETYYTKVEETTLNFKHLYSESSFIELRKSNKESLLDLLKNFDNANALIRIENYFDIRLFEKLISKIISEVSLRDINLLNKAKESYIKYKEICEATIQSI